MSGATSCAMRWAKYQQDEDFGASEIPEWIISFMTNQTVTVPKSVVTATAHVKHPLFLINYDLTSSGRTHYVKETV